METKLEQIAATAVKQRPKSVVREIRTPRSVGTGGGRPPPVPRWALSNGCPYREQPIFGVLAPPQPLPINHLLCENPRTEDRIGEVGLTPNGAQRAFDFQ